MQISLNTNYNPNFQAKVSPRFENSMRQFINNGENRIKRIYLLNDKIEQIRKFGHDDITIELHQKSSTMGNEYYIMAVKDNCPDKQAILKKRYSYRKMFESFMKITKGDFNRCVRYLG